MDNILIFNGYRYILREAPFNKWRTHVEDENQRISLENIGYPTYLNTNIYESDAILIKGKYYVLIPILDKTLKQN